MTAPLLNPNKTALLSMDLQAGIVSIYTKGDQTDFLARVSSVLDWARSNKLHVIHVRVAFRPGLPEVSARNTFFATIKQSAQHQKLFEGPTGEIHPAVSPQPDEVVIIKHRVSAFRGTDLDMILRANEIDTLILMGIAISGVVLSTAIEASDNDYRIIVVSDCCADLDPELHSCLLEKFFPQRATVLKAADLINKTMSDK
jgi:nicotinamidase-related amidase